MILLPINCCRSSSVVSMPSTNPGRSRSNPSTNHIPGPFPLSNGQPSFLPVGSMTNDSPGTSSRTTSPSPWPAEGSSWPSPRPRAWPPNSPQARGGGCPAGARRACRCTAQAGEDRYTIRRKRETKGERHRRPPCYCNGMRHSSRRRDHPNP